MSFYAFGEGFLRGVQGHMDRNEEERRRLRERLIDRFDGVVQQYQQSAREAQEVLRYEEMYTNMGLAPQLAALAAYEGVKPSEIGAYARRFEATSDGQVQDNETGRTIDVAQVTGMVPETQLQAAPRVNAPAPTGAQEAAAQTQTMMQGGASRQSSMLPEDTRGFMDRLMGAPNLGAQSREALIEVANMYAVDPQDIIHMMQNPQILQLPDVQGVRARSDLELLNDELALRDRYSRRGSGGGGDREFLGPGRTDVAAAVNLLVPGAMSISPTGEVVYNNDIVGNNPHVLPLHLAISDLTIAAGDRSPSGAFRAAAMLQEAALSNISEDDPTGWNTTLARWRPQGQIVNAASGQ